MSCREGIRAILAEHIGDQMHDREGNPIVWTSTPAEDALLALIAKAGEPVWRRADDPPKDARPVYCLHEYGDGEIGVWDGATWLSVDHFVFFPSKWTDLHPHRSRPMDRPTRLNGSPLEFWPASDPRARTNWVCPNCRGQRPTLDDQAVARVIADGLFEYIERKIPEFERVWGAENRWRVFGLVLAFSNLGIQSAFDRARQIIAMQAAPW